MSPPFHSNNFQRLPEEEYLSAWRRCKIHIMSALLEKFLKTTLRQALLAANEVKMLKNGIPSEPQIEVSVISAARMRSLNATYRGKDYATDVLSFPTPEALRTMGHLGELVICSAVLKKQAKEQGHPERVEATILAVHGLLHLLGFDHERGRREATQMRKLETAVLAAMNMKKSASRGLIERAESGNERAWPKSRQAKASLRRTKSARSSRK